MAEGLMSYDEVGAFLDEAAERLPAAFFRELNGGIVLQPEVMPSPHSLGGDLYTLGMYHHQPRGLGRYIVIYYGSFARLYANAPRERQQAELDRVLRHELTHHMESLAGVRDLTVKDERQLAAYRRRHGRRGGGEEK